jgi:hypothetical protein
MKQGVQSAFGGENLLRSRRKTPIIIRMQILEGEEKNLERSMEFPQCHLTYALLNVGQVIIIIIIIYF